MRTLLTSLIVLMVLYSCEKEESTIKEKPPYGGVITIDTLGNHNSDSIIGTTWVITKWSNGLQTTDRNDTLYFINSFLYMYGNIRNQYTLTTSGSQYSLILEGTPIGDLSGLAPRSFIEYGELTNALMKDISNGNNGATYQIWMKRTH